MAPVWTEKSAFSRTSSALSETALISTNVAMSKLKYRQQQWIGVAEEKAVIICITVVRIWDWIC